MAINFNEKIRKKKEIKILKAIRFGNITRKRLFRIVKRTFLVVTVIGLLLLHFYVPRIITEIKNPFITSSIPQKNYNDENFNGKSISYMSEDGLNLCGYLVYSESDTAKGTIILVHGIRGYKEHFIPISKILAQKGYNSVAIDLRAHGESEGLHCTFGVKEREDISQLISYLQISEGIKGSFGIWGQSLGGAVSLQALGIDKRIQFGIIESTFSEFRIIVGDYFAQHAGFSFSFLTNYLIYRAGKIAEFNPDEASPLEYCKNIDQPVLLVHGTKDARVKIDYAIQNFTNLKNEKSEFIQIEGANHLNVWKVGEDAYFETVFEFIGSCSTISLHTNSGNPL